MAFTTTCIDTALGDLKLLTNNIVSKRSGGLSLLEVQLVNSLFRVVSILMSRLGSLRTFILCVRKFGNDTHPSTDGNNSNKEGSLGSLRVRIEEAVGRNAQEIHPYCLTFEAGLIMDATCKLLQFTEDIDSFEKEIEEWYINLTDLLQQSVSPTTDEVMEITDSVLENLEDIRSPSGAFKLVLVMESLVEMMKFLRSFVRFATLRRVERQQLQDLLNHIEAVAVNAAHLSFKCEYKVFDNEWRYKVMQPEISVLLRKIKPIGARIYATYTQALTSSKLSTQLHASISDVDGDPIMIMKDFICYLVSCLWEILQMDTFPVVSVKNQLQVLHGRLRFLRTILPKQLNKLDENIKDSIGVLICDAGLIIFSLYQKDIKIDIEFKDLLERIEHIQKQVEEKDPETSNFNFCRTNELGFIDYLVENLMDVTSSMAGSNAQSFAQKIQEQLVFLRSILVEIVDLHNELEELHTLWNHVLQVAERVEFLIDHLMVEDISNSFSVLYDSIMEDIDNIKTDASKIITGKRQDIKTNKVTKKSSHVPAQSSAPEIDEVVGFDDESTRITDRLTRGSQQLRIIAIVGMAGLGKTTLATKVYNDNLVMRHFHVRARSTVSQVLNKKKVLLELLNHVVPNKSFEMDEHELAQELWKGLKRRRYLIFLDDVWDVEAWNILGLSFPDDSNGSRIILTSRLSNVAPHAMLDADPHFLRQLTIDESLELLQRKLFPGIGWPPELDDLGMQIAANCKGLPLTIVIVAGLLANLEKEKWNEILESLRSGILSTTAQCMNTLELSYKHLPDYLKPCFLYFGMFPEDQVVSTKKLIWLWIAEGFVRKIKLKCIEDVARDYLMDLIGRSLVLVANRRSIGGVKACRVHDLLHEFCMKKAKEEIFFKQLRGYDELLAFNGPRNVRRLSIQSEPTHFREARLFCPRVRSLLFFTETKGLNNMTSLDISFVIHKLLRVLDIGQIYLLSLFPNSVFPVEIELLAQLRYLSVRGMIREIPSSIGNLSYLETFVVDSLVGPVSFPDTLWNLRKLRHLCVNTGSDGFSFAIENLENFSDLYELESCSGVTIVSCSSMEKQMKKFPNVRKLKCKLFQNWNDAKNCNRIIVPDFLSQIESLVLSVMRPPRASLDFEFGLPANLKKLTLSKFRLSWSKISSIGKLPNLEVLKLVYVFFSGQKWDMEEGEFSRLRFLKLTDMDIVKWTASDDQFPNLQKLVVHRCKLLKEIPSCLENTVTLETIEVSDCRRSLTSSVNQIQEEQMNMGNSDLKILVLRELKD